MRNSANIRRTEFQSAFFLNFNINNKIRLQFQADSSTFPHRTQSFARCTPFFRPSKMKFTFILSLTFFLTSYCFGQKSDYGLLKAYKSNSNKKLQAFIESWIKETSIQIDSVSILSNDTLSNIYGIINIFYTPKYPKTNCVLMQPTIQFTIVDNLDKDTLLKRTIYTTFKKNPDSVYKIAIANPSRYERIAEENGTEVYNPIKSGIITVSTKNLIFKEKRVLPLTDKYVSILSKYLLDNSQEQREERSKRLNFIRKEIQFFEGNYGYIRIANAPFGISIIMDSSYQNAIISYRGSTCGGRTTLKKIDNKWTEIENHRTMCE